MRGPLAVLVTLFATTPVLGQEKDLSLERMANAIQQPPAVVIDLAPGPGEFPRKLGPFTLVAPVKRGEMIRLSIPIGEYVGRAVDGIATANRRRKEAAVRRRIEGELKLFEEHRRKK